MYHLIYLFISGAEDDGKNLVSMYEKLGFIVRKHVDCTTTEMLMILKKG